MQTMAPEDALRSFCCSDHSTFVSDNYQPRTGAETTFWAWLEKVVQSHSRELLLIQGPPGSGKSWLGAYLATQVTAKAQAKGLPPLKGAHLPWPLEEGADIVAFLRGRLGLPPGPVDILPEAWLHDALERHLRRSGQRLVLFVDNLDRLPKERVEIIVDTWLHNLALKGLPIWLVLVYFGPLHDPELRLRGVSRLSLGAFRTTKEALQEHYRHWWRLGAGASEAAYDFRYPLLNTWLRYEADKQRTDDEDMPASFWRRGLACLLCRRPATQPWAQALFSDHPLATLPSLPETTPQKERGSMEKPRELPWFPLRPLYDLFGAAGPGHWDAPSEELVGVYRLPYGRVRRAWWPTLAKLHESDFLDDDVLAYTMDASLWRFWHDALRQLALATSP